MNINYIFWHERKIINRLDDSVVQINRKKLVTIEEQRFCSLSNKTTSGFDNQQ